MGREYGARGGYGRGDDRPGRSRGRRYDNDRGGSRGDDRGGSRGRGGDRRGGGDRGEERDRYPAAERISKIGGKCGRCDEPIDIGDQYVLGLDREGGGTCLDCVCVDGDGKDEVKPWFPSEESALLIRVLRAVEGRGRRADRRAELPEDPPEDDPEAVEEENHERAAAAAEAAEEKKAPKRGRKS